MDHDRDERLDRALHAALAPLPADEAERARVEADDEAWLARALGALEARSAGAASGAASTGDELDALLAPPLPDGAVAGEPRPEQEAKTIGQDDPWPANELEPIDAPDDAESIASHASDPGRAPDLAAISLRPDVAAQAEQARTEAKARRARRRDVGWMAGLAVAAAALIGLIGLSLHGGDRRNTDAKSVAQSKEEAKAVPSTAPTPSAPATEAVVATAGPLASASVAEPLVAVATPKPTAGDPTAMPKLPPATKPMATGFPVATAAPPATATATATIAATATVAATATTSPTATRLADRPDPMDLRSALNFRIAAANQCVAGMAGSSHVTIHFGPTGSVSSVTVTDGPAKGTPAEACIQKAFSTARTEPSKLGGDGYAVVSDGK
jgi:hypothetical protein